MIEILTAQKLIDSLDFSEFDPGTGDFIKITKNSILFFPNLKSWIENNLAENWSKNEKYVLLNSNFNDPFIMTKNEYANLISFI